MYNKEYKFLFIHPQKCAGGSIKECIKRKIGFNNVEQPQYSGHWSLSQFDDYIDEDISNYFKFSVVRNPWDRAVSYFFHLRKHLGYKKSFGMFCRENYLKNMDYKLKEKFFLKGEFGLDFLIRFENLEEDFDTVMNKLKIKDYHPLKKIDYNTARSNKDYKSFYTYKTRKIVEENSAWEIDNFSYKF